MRYFRTLGLQIATFSVCLIMMILQVSMTSKSLPEKHPLFTFMVVAGFIVWLIGLIVTCASESSIGFGLCTLSAFFIIVGCALPDASSGSLSELLIIYIPMLLVPTSLIAVRGGANFKRVMLFTIGILYAVVSIYLFAKSIQTLESLNTKTYYISSTQLKQIEIAKLSVAYSFFSFTYYIMMIICGGVLFRNYENIPD